MSTTHGFAIEVVQLKDAADAAVYGTKAASLATIARADLPVPAGFAIAADAYRSHMEHAGVAELVEALRAIPEDEPDVASTSQLQRIRSAIVRTPLDPALASIIDRAFDDMGDGPVSVRSSLTADDRPAGSFAPQHGTYFAPNHEAAKRNIQHCWAALWTDWAWRHRAHDASVLTEPAVAIVVQSLVPADASGVIFTADPHTGDHQRMIVESCLGLGEALVAAKVAPDRFTLSREGFALLEQCIGDKSRELGIRADGSIHEIIVEPERALSPSLDAPTLGRIAALAVRTAGAVGAAAAVEFCVADGALWLLQGRPIVFDAN